MGQFISTNNVAISARNDLDRSSTSVQKSLERLSSGQRINRASDDAAGMAIASRMTSQIRGMEVAARNAQDGISLVQVADGSMGSQVEILQRMRELSVQASNGMLSQSDRNKLHNEMSMLSDENGKLGINSNFNGHKLLDGSISGMELQVGANTGDVRTISLPDTRPVTLGIVAETFDIVGAAGLEIWSSDVVGVGPTIAGDEGSVQVGHINLQTQDNSQEALSVIDAAIDVLNDGRANAGAYQNRLENVISGLDVFVNNTTTSRSRIQDADFAKETADLAKNQILSQAGVAMVSQANQIPQNVLSLIK